MFKFVLERVESDRHSPQFTWIFNSIHCAVRAQVERSCIYRAHWDESIIK